MTINEDVQNLRNNTGKAEKFFSEKLAFTIGPVELQKLSEENNVKILDVRKLSDYEVGHIPGAVSMPYDDILDRLDMLDKDNLNVVYCYNAFCHLGAKAALLLASKGYPVVELCGGYDTWAEDFHFAVVQ